jgi:hypothetical protein
MFVIMLGGVGDFFLFFCFFYVRDIDMGDVGMDESVFMQTHLRCRIETSLGRILS